MRRCIYVGHGLPCRHEPTCEINECAAGPAAIDWEKHARALREAIAASGLIIRHLLSAEREVPSGLEAISVNARIAIEAFDEEVGR